MNTSADPFVAAAFKLCSAMMPPARSEWLHAMHIEATYIDGRFQARAFALGCCWGCLKERMSTMEFVHKAARLAMTLGMLALGIVAALSAWRVADDHGPTGLVFALLSIAFLASGLWSCVRGPAAVVQAASTMLIVSAVSFVALHSSIGEDWFNLHLYRALSVEGILIWGVLLGGALFLKPAKPVAA